MQNKKDGEIIGSIDIEGKDKFCFFAEVSSGAAENYYTDYSTGETIRSAINEKINMTENEAVNIAKGIFEDLEIEGMALSVINKIYFYEEDNIEYGGYTMVFMREYGGMMPLIIDGYGQNVFDNYEVMSSIGVEKITIDIDEYGNITKFIWDNPIKIIETLTEHVDILPFDEIMTQFKEFSRQRFGYNEGNMGNVLCVNNVYSIDFKLMYILLKNNPTEFIYAPCWIFTYKENIEYTEKQIKEVESSPGYIEIPEELLSESYVILSAVDGTSISSYPTEWIEEKRNEE